MAAGKCKYKFLAEPDDALKCLICLDVAEKPWQHDKCGKLFCESCLDDWKWEHSFCPHCREEGPQYFVDSKSKEEIQALAVQCDASAENCKWEGTLSMLKEHAQKCDFSQFKCPNCCKVKSYGDQIQQYLRKDLDKHLISCPNRQFECERCGEKGTYAYITKRHDKLCTMKVVSCSNAGCSSTMLRRGLKRHLEDCEYSLISCKYVKLGCNVKLQRRDMPAHELDDKGHLRMSLDTISSLQEKLERQKQGEALIFKISNFSQKKVNRVYFTSPPFYSHSGGYCLVADMIFDIDEESEDEKNIWGLHLAVKNGDYDDKLKWPVEGMAYFTFLNQEKNEGHYTEAIDFCLNREGDHFPETSLEYNPIPSFSPLYLKDDTLYVRISVDVDDHKPWLSVPE